MVDKDPECPCNQKVPGGGPGPASGFTSAVATATMHGFVLPTTLPFD